LADDSPSGYFPPNRKEHSVQQLTSTAQYAVRPQARAVATARDENSLLRGLTYGVVLSAAVWILAGYVTFALR
jgi:hypothetical protein